MNETPHVLLVARRLSNSNALVTVLLKDVPDGSAEDVVDDYCAKHNLRLKTHYRCESVEFTTPL